MRKHQFLAAILGLTGLTAGAQLNSSVSVEGEYEPLVIETERLNSFPAGYKFELPAATLAYELDGVVTDFRPDLLTMGATGRMTDWPWKKRRGFVDLRLGSYLNSRLHAGYYILNDSVNTLLAELRFRSSTLSKTRGIPDDYSEGARKRLFDGRIGLSFTRLLGDEGLLETSAGYHAAYFNYYGTSVPLGAATTAPHVPSQTVNGADARISYSSSPSTVRGWHAEAGVDFTAYRRLYGAYSGHADGFPSQRGDSETALDVGAGYAFPFAESSAMAVDAKGDFLFYPSRLPEVLGIDEGYGRRNYGVVTITPAYRFAGDQVKINAGVDLAASYDAMGNAPGKRFGGFHVAPDVAIDYRSPSGVGLFIKATGGVTPASLLLREEFDRYQMPWLLTTEPIYTPVDASVGVNAGPFAGFAASVAVRYACSRNVPLGGWYQAFLGAWLPYRSLPTSGDLVDPYMQSANLHGLSVNLGLRYDLGKLLHLEFDGTYTPQSGNEGIFNGFDRPRLVFAAKAAVRPVRRLDIELGYDYRGVRNCYCLAEGSPGAQLKAWRLQDITDLNARIGYRILDNLEIYCKAENLLNRRVDLLPGLQSEGMVVSGGFWIVF